MKRNIKKLIVSFATIAALFLITGIYQGIIFSQTTPFNLRQILNAIYAINTSKGNEKNVLYAKILKEVKQRGVDFPMSKDYETQLKNEGATDELINAIRENSSRSITPPTSTPAPPTLTSNNAKTFKNSIGMEFVSIPSGTFMMGSANGRDNERPVHKVTINYEFYMGKYEVTQGQWQALMKNNPVRNTSYFNPSCVATDCPVTYVSWDEIQTFIKKLNEKNDGYEYNLPSESEWEYACRAGTTGDFYGKLNLIAWSSLDDGKIHPVGQKQPNDFGLYDMSGNVEEVVKDIYNPTYEGLPVDGSSNMSISKSNIPYENPTNVFRITRGGAASKGYNNPEAANNYNLRSSTRRVFLSILDYNLGFRVAARKK